MIEKKGVLHLKRLDVFRDLLKKNGYTVNSVHKAFCEKIEELKKKKYVTEKDPLDDTVYKRPVGKFVTLIQSNYPVKMFVLREVYANNKQEEPEVRIGYYIVSQRLLKKKGKISLQWGQFNPNFPKEDLKELINRAHRKGIM